MTTELAAPRRGPVMSARAPIVCGMPTRNNFTLTIDLSDCDPDDDDDGYARVVSALNSATTDIFCTGQGSNPRSSGDIYLIGGGRRIGKWRFP